MFLEELVCIIVSCRCFEYGHHLTVEAQMFLCRSNTCEWRKSLSKHLNDQNKLQPQTVKEYTRDTTHEM